MLRVGYHCYYTSPRRSQELYKLHYCKFIATVWKQGTQSNANKFHSSLNIIVIRMQQGVYEFYKPEGLRL